MFRGNELGIVIIGKCGTSSLVIWIMDFMRSLWVGPKSRNMQVDLALMLRLEMAHSTYENAFFSRM